jgi:hypothetical protein
MRLKLKLPGFSSINWLIFGTLSTLVMAQESSGNLTLKEQLDATNKGFTERMDPAVVQNIETAITEVGATGVLETAKQIGDSAPDFTLPDATGKHVQLSSLLKNGPVVLTWYRGNW